MKFPGRRKTKHYFPVTEKGRVALTGPVSENSKVYVTGLDQVLVDIEIEVDDTFLNKYQFNKGESFIIEDALCEEIYQYAKSNNMVKGEYPGGAVGNTLHNFSILSESPSYALGCINKHIVVGDYAYGYLSKTSALVDMSYLQPSATSMGRALCFITPDLERTFAISKGCMNDYRPESIPEKIIRNSCALLVSAYTLRNQDEPIFESTIRSCELAKEYNVPVIMSLGTSTLVEAKKEYLMDFSQKYVTMLAMNLNECQCLIGEDDPLRACETLLESVDMALVTVGKKGLYLAGYTDEQHKRETSEPLVTKSIVNYNQFEYSRAQRRRDCKDPLKIYTHIAPFNGGPLAIKNTNGAGDAALSAVLHDLAANLHHKDLVPNSPKHEDKYLTYSSISQISKYANRVSFEVLSQNSPRLYKGLPEREDVLEEGYWSK
ncbi:MAG: inosine/guanosine kinase [Halobacteriovoraceae bacterium]|nr:inosine/guanosine kinase [Halobacteriovoraceae bacterium]|tara:strand:+ start:12151 stop:13449 length:1299 start_codon:yes stop_codon:yes gene_type:complete